MIMYLNVFLGIKGMNLLQNKTLELTKKIKAQGLDSDTIHKITGISIDEINKL